MRSLVPLSRLIALSLACAVGACTSVYGQPRPSQPHGVVNMTVLHEEPSRKKASYDVVYLDGMRIDISEHKGPFTLRLSPGKHSLEMASAPLRYEMKVTLEQDPIYGPSCQFGHVSTDPTCAAHPPSYQERMSLVPSERGGCAQEFPLHVKAGETLDVTLRVDEQGRCL
jgi:hypothetical protein